MIEIGNAWKSACRVLLGGEVGALGEFAPYLREYVEPTATVKSFISGKEAAVSQDGFGTGAKFIAYDEIGEYGKKFGGIKPDLEEIRDLGSAIAALKGRFAYCGGITLGNSMEISASQRCTNAQMVQNSHDVSDSKYVAYSAMVRPSAYVFGSSFHGESDFVVKGFQVYRSARCFEALRTLNSSDCYFSANLDDCHDCMFCFNLRNKSNCIGNVQLPREEYVALKGKLLEEMREELKAKKRLYGIIGLLSGNPMPPENLAVPAQKNGGGRRFPPPSRQLEKTLDDAFASTALILFGRKLARLAEYENWLLRRVRAPFRVKSAVSGREVYASPLLFNVPLARALASLEESLELGKGNIGKADAALLNLGNAPKMLEKIAFCTAEYVMGENASMEQCVNYGESMNCYAGSTYYFCKNCAYCFWPHGNESTFGCDFLLYSKFCINCRRSQKLARCFEVSDSLSCTDSYFCHNCEDLENCMFCFNSRGLRHAIGNVEVGKEKYMEVKKMLLGEIGQKLTNGKSLEYDIYNIGEGN